MLIPRKGRELRDGIYDVTGIAICDAESYIRSEHADMFKIRESVEHPEKIQEIINFLEKYPEFVIASAYNTDYCILLSEMPKEANVERIGPGFNYGSTNILKNCPDHILILAEDD